MLNLLNFVLFQIVWVIAVGCAAAGMAWPGIVAALVFAAVHFLWLSKKRAADLRVVVVAVIVGFALDSAIVAAGWLGYAAPHSVAWLAPWWILGLWLAFSLTLNHSLGWMQGRWLLAVVFGAVGGPLVFFFASHFWHAVDIADPQWQGYLALGIEWAIMTPLLLYVGANARFFGKLQEA